MLVKTARARVEILHLSVKLTMFALRNRTSTTTRHLVWRRATNVNTASAALRLHASPHSPQHARPFSVRLLVSGREKQPKSFLLHVLEFMRTGKPQHLRSVSRAQPQTGSCFPRTLSYIAGIGVGWKGIVRDRDGERGVGIFLKDASDF